MRDGKCDFTEMFRILKMKSLYFSCLSRQFANRVFGDLKTGCCKYYISSPILINRLDGRKKKLAGIGSVGVYRLCQNEENGNRSHGNIMIPL